MIKIGVFSGRFDPPNSGHFMTIEKLLYDYHFLIVPILDYKEREACSALQAKVIFEHHFRMILPEITKNKLRFITNTEHFGKITPYEYKQLLEPFDLKPNNVIYLSGNQEVLDHMKEIGIKSEFVQRVAIPGLDQYAFESTKIRKTMNVMKKSLSEIYNIK